VLSTSIHTSGSRIARRLIAVGAAAAMMAFGLAVPSASASTPVLPAPTALRTIEPMAAYVPSDSCDPQTKPGTAALAALLAKTYTGTIYYTVRPCEASVSEHYQGRAIDWMVSAKDSAQYADAAALFRYLFATDAYGNTYSNARRLGVMYLVYNNLIWGSWDRKWQPYNNCANQPGSAYDNSCHRTHVHISLSWEGANKRTSFWTNKPVGTDYGPCKSPTLNWAGLPLSARTTPCSSHGTLTAPSGASTLYKQVVPWSGARAVLGNTGPVVAAVQRVIGVTADGDFGPNTMAALERWQTAHHIPANGTADQVTWHTIMDVV
jgi:peptidoglycan hydrolase-like protein with peptidoglycan-binding domain